MCPDQELNWRHFALHPVAQPAEPHQSGGMWIFNKLPGDYGYVAITRKVTLRRAKCQCQALGGHFIKLLSYLRVCTQKVFKFEEIVVCTATCSLFANVFPSPL